MMCQTRRKPGCRVSTLWIFITICGLSLTVILYRTPVYFCHFSNTLSGSNNLSPLSTSDAFIPILEYPRCCSDADQPEVLWYIYNMPNNDGRRNYIRETFSKQSRFSQVLGLIFVVGRLKNEDKEMRLTILDKARTHGDILYVDFTEDYYNFTYKGVAFMKFAAERCDRVKYVIKSDDDIVINVDGIITELRKHDPSSLHLFGEIFQNGIIRDPSSPAAKWIVDYRDFPRRCPDVYPKYCHGQGFGMTRSVVKAIYENIPKEPYLWIDDVYMTGILLDHVENIHWHSFPKVLENLHPSLDYLSDVERGAKTQLPMLIRSPLKGGDYEFLTSSLLHAVMVVDSGI